MQEREILDSEKSLCADAVRDLGPRFGVEPQEFADMLAEHHAHKAAIDAALIEWLDSRNFSGRLAEPVLRQCFWRVLAATELLSVADISIVSERGPQDCNPEGLLRYILVEAWTDTTAPQTWLGRLSRGETLFHARMLSQDTRDD